MWVEFRRCFRAGGCLTEGIAESGMPEPGMLEADARGCGKISSEVCDVGQVIGSDWLTARARSGNFFSALVAVHGVRFPQRALTYL